MHPDKKNPDWLIGAANERAVVPASPWLQVCPWGEFDNEVGLQRVTRVQGDAMVRAFNSLLGRMGRLFRGVPIYVGHPDVKPERYPDKRRYGKLVALDARADGLYAQAAWNDLGEQNLREGYYLYPSPVWAVVRRAGNVIEPCELLSIGLTNLPNIGEVQPWAMNSREGANPVARAVRQRAQCAAQARARRAHALPGRARPADAFADFYGFPSGRP